MLRRNLLTRTTHLAVVLCCFSSSFLAAKIYAQTGESIAEMKERAVTLLDQTKYTEALPLLEKIVVAEPDNAEMQFGLASALIGQVANTKDLGARKALRIRARSAFIKSKDLGLKSPKLDALIQTLPVDGSDPLAFSDNSQANALMLEGEALFTQGKFDDAQKSYQKALELDPKLYHAALFSGDAFSRKGDFAQAEIWYKRAIAIDPDKETAYRYSATPLMKQGKTQEARERYVEAYILEPYNRFSVAGLAQWAESTKTVLSHPKIEFPTDVTFDEKGNAKINLHPSALQGKDDGSFAWISYGATRSMWRKERFARMFPNEPVYRHSLAEEADALRSVISIATADKKVKMLNPSLAKLKKLNDEGLLEAYILLARADEDVLRDYPAYLKASREKLRRYVMQYVLTGGAN